MEQFVPNLRDDRVTSAIRRLIIYSAAIIIVPLSSMFFFKKVIFQGWYQLSGFHFGFKKSWIFKYMFGIFISWEVIFGKRWCRWLCLFTYFIHTAVLMTLISDWLQYPTGDANMYSAIIAVIQVHIVLGFFVYAAYKEEFTPGPPLPVPIPEKQD